MFDAAIGWLKMGVDFHEESHYDRDSCKAAIRVLEAAAGITPGDVMELFDFSPRVPVAIQELLEAALPGGDKK